MSYSTDRATKGNVKGIQAVQEASDPLKQKNIMLFESQLRELKAKAFETGKSESEIIREGLEHVL